MALRIAVTGWTGQVVCAMLERVPVGVEVIAIRRPELDLANPRTVAPALRAAKPDVIVNTAAYTAVDQAESEPDLAMRVNGEAAGEAARAAAALGVPVIQLSTDYVFDGSLDRPYREDDATGPLSTYGASKLAGEEAVAAATADHAILRTAWIYSAFGKNFVKTMLRLGEARDEIGVVADQMGSPTNALDIADAIFAVARNMTGRADDPSLRGVFHMSAAGEAVWADVAEAIFTERERLGGRPVGIKRIATTDYPTPARRPANSRLDCGKLALIHGVRLPDWQVSLRPCVARLLQAQNKDQR
ncbi:MAG: dTDP-4-dehydrorhamnose reductase [Bosea sp.]|uniref:dTDP-4-dehydrorhamnose reductase n=1 Tax=Bosea sp. (in: a-proteobacteria) TaxID=1871050 RepID=UPI001ACD8716|nr:dTDP-4-dehydrorhamnose reductase [Bosea sp. (in: a-proteobacteria)]MBN9467203.1 dTDP-4-dehydrorhamnose reductase [Bosea sp. (in: a-proteobacteria)]